MKRSSFSVLCLVLLGLSACNEAAPKTVAKAVSVKPVANVAPAPTPVPTVEPKIQTAPDAPPLVSMDVDSPTLVIQKYTDELKKIVDFTIPTDQRKIDTNQEKKIADKVRQFFDFDGLARMSLGTNWNKATPAQRDEYMELFVGLIEDSYLRKTRDLVGDYKIVYGREEVKANRAKVFSRVVRNDADVEITYELHKNPRNWMIYNIDLDGVDLIRNYQTQFNRIIQNDGFTGLLSKLRKKKDEAQKEVTF